MNDFWMMFWIVVALYATYLPPMWWFYKEMKELDRMEEEIDERWRANN